MRKGNAKASIKLGEIQKVQRWLSTLIIGESHHQPHNAEITYLDDVEVLQRTPALTNALKQVKFHWKILAGVLSRNSKGHHHIYIKTFYNHKHDTLAGLAPDIYTELKKMMDKESNPQHHLTTFYIASPDQDMPTYKLMATALLLLHKHRVPDVMATNYEFDVKGLNKVSTSYCNSTYWFNNVNWDELSLETIALNAFDRIDDNAIHFVEQHLADCSSKILLNQIDDLSFTEKLIAQFKQEKIHE